MLRVCDAAWVWENKEHICFCFMLETHSILRLYRTFTLGSTDIPGRNE